MPDELVDRLRQWLELGREAALPVAEPGPYVLAPADADSAFDPSGVPSTG